MRKLLVILVIPLALSCNRRVFEEVKNSCDKTIAQDVPVPINKSADILIVVDNSGSMSEEQQNLVANFLNQNPNECPLTDLKNIPAEFKNPIRDLYTNNGPLAKCGFIQLLAAFESDFRVGVITTDVGLCDNRLPQQQAGAFCAANPGSPSCQQADGGGWGFRPQRGCLQPDGPPGAVRKFIAAADLKDADNTNDDFAQRFKDTLDNIQTFGSPFERGLDAASIFLGQVPGVSPNPDCAGDLGSFRRADAALVVMFLSDEEDCSHFFPDTTLANENDGEVCGEFLDIVRNHNPGDCYCHGTDCADTTLAEGPSTKLSPIDDYKNALLAADPQVKVAVIAGGLGAPGNVSAAGCQIVNGAPEGTCFDSGGLSNFTTPGQSPPSTCGPEEAASRGIGCCTADPGSRYFDLATAIGNKRTDSICNSSFSSTMLDIAAFIAAVDSVELAEAPVSPNAVIVELTKAGTTNATTVPHLTDAQDCAHETGWKLDGATRVVLCGAARPGPGDNISVRAEGAAVNGCQ